MVINRSGVMKGLSEKNGTWYRFFLIPLFLCIYQCMWYNIFVEEISERKIEDLKDPCQALAFLEVMLEGYQEDRVQDDG